MDQPGGAARSAVLETIRRALGKLATQTRVREVPIAASAGSVEVGRLSVRAGERPRPGLREGEVNAPEVVLDALSPPNTVVSGGAVGSQDAQSLFWCRVSENAASVALAQSARLSTSLVRRPGAHAAVAAITHPRVSSVESRPAGGEVRAAAGFEIARKARIGRRFAQERTGLPVMRAPRAARVPASLAERIPLDRSRLPMPARGSLEWQAAYLQERQLLAHAAGPGVPFTEIELVGVYRKVPITAARRLEVEKGTNSLLLYLRPQAALGATAAQKPVVTIAIGRVKSDGRLVRTVIRQ